MTTRSARLAAVAVAMFACASFTNAATVSYFNFNNSDLGRSGGSTGTFTTMLNTGSASFANNGTMNNAQNGDAPGKDITISAGTGFANNGAFVNVAFSSVGFSNLSLSFAAQRSGTGFTSLEILYSTNGSTFTSFTTLNTPTAYGTIPLSVDFSSITALNENANAALQIKFSGATNTGGNVRFDNVVVASVDPTGTPSAVPLPPAAIAGTALLGVVGFLKRRRPLASV